MVINEIMYNPSTSGTEHVEIHNRSDTWPFDLSGWVVEGVQFTFPGGTILWLGQYGVVADRAPGYADAYTNAEVLLGVYGGALDNAGECLRLLMPVGTDNWLVVDEVCYDDAPPWPVLADGFGPSLQLVDSSRDNNRAANWAVDTNRLWTPGEANSVTASLPELPLVWINEIMPSNVNSVTDNFGEHAPWLELYNAGTSAVNLADGYYLTTALTNLNAWAFPAGWVIPPGERLLVWADGQTGQTAPGFLHAGIILNGTTGIVALVWRYGGCNFLLDALAYDHIAPDLSYGSFPEGSPYNRVVFYFPSPGTANTPTSQPITVCFNEWMAKNTKTIPDGGSWDDWFELYNYGPATVGLGGCYLTDKPDNPTKFRISDMTLLAPQSWMLVWADEDTRPNAPGRPLHVNFKLDDNGEYLGLYAPDGALVDEVYFGRQTADVSEGRWPDGSGSRYFLWPPRPALRTKCSWFTELQQLPISWCSAGSLKLVAFTAWTGEATCLTAFGSPSAR